MLSAHSLLFLTRMVFVFTRLNVTLGKFFLLVYRSNVFLIAILQSLISHLLTEAIFNKYSRDQISGKNSFYPVANAILPPEKNNPLKYISSP